MSWQISTDRSTWTDLAAAGITACTLQFIACGVDTAQLTVSGDYLASPLATHGATLYLRDESGTQRFIGRLTTLPRMAQGIQEHYQVTLAGGWWWLERVSAQQHWTTRSPAATDYARMIVGQDEQGRPRSLGSTITTALTRAIDRGAAIAIGNIAALGTLPAFEVSNQRCADIILSCLRYFPDYIVTWDYAGAVPAISITAPSDISPTAIDLNATRPTDLQIAPRYGDQAPGVRVIYEVVRETTDDETNETTIVQDHIVDVAGSANDPLAVELVFPLRGPSTHRALIESLSQEIVVEGVYSSQKWFWRNLFFGSLGAIADEDWTIDEVETPDFRYLGRLVSGAITSWMKEDYNHQVHLDEWVITVTIHRRDASDRIVSSAVRRLAVRFWSTNALSGTYTRERYEAVQADPGDDIPSGLALNLYHSWSRLLYDGRATWIGTRFYSLGMRLNLSHGRPEWASMDALVRQIDYDIGLDQCTLTLGPAARLEADAALALARGTRAYRKPEVRRSASPDDPNYWSIGATLATSEQNLGEGDMGALSRLMLTEAETDDTITLDTDLIDPDDEAEVALDVAPRMIWECAPTFDEVSGDLTKLTFSKRSVLCSEPIGTPVDVTVADCEGGGDAV